MGERRFWGGRGKGERVERELYELNRIDHGSNQRRNGNQSRVESRISYIAILCVGQSPRSQFGYVCG